MLLLRRLALVPMLVWATGALALGELDAIRDLVRTGRLDAAATQIDAYLATQADDPQARFLKSMVLVRQGRPGAAIALLRQLAKDYPRLPEPYNNLAVLYADQGNYEAARDALLQAINAHPSYATAQENLGDIYVKMAGDAYDTALQIDRANRTAKAKLALIDQLFARATGRSAGVGIGSPPPGAASPVSAPPGVPARRGSGVREAVRASLDDWARAWSRQDVDGYLAHYAPSFQPPRGLSRAAWERQRRTRLKRPARIEVKLSALRFQSITTSRVRLTLIQDYRSDSYRDRVRKRIVVVNGNGHWRIAGERTLR